jgi:hypothetical protein
LSSLREERFSDIGRLKATVPSNQHAPEVQVGGANVTASSGKNCGAMSVALASHHELAYVERALEAVDGHCRYVRKIVMSGKKFG